MTEVKEDDASLSNTNNITKYQTAADIANRAIVKVSNACVIGATVLALSQLGNEFMNEELSKVYNKKVNGQKVHKSIAFPTSINVNHVIAHYCPCPGDSGADYALKVGDFIKIELGVQIDGFPAMVGHTVVVGATAEKPVTGKHADVLQAAYTAAEVALRLLRPEKTNWDVTDAVQKVVVNQFGCMPIEGMLSSELRRTVLDGQKQIIFNPTEKQRVERETTKFALGEVYSIDILVSSGSDGKPKLSTELKTGIYKRTEVNYQLKMQTSRKFYSEISQKFGYMPFAIRDLEDVKKGKMGLSECLKHEMVYPYEVIEEKPEHVVAQFLFTVLLMPNGNLLKITNFPFKQELVKSDKKLTDPELLAVLESSTKAPKKQNKEAEMIEHDQLEVPTLPIENEAELNIETVNTETLNVNSKAEKSGNKFELTSLKDSESSTPNSTPKLDKLSSSKKNLIKKSNELFSVKTAKTFVQNSFFGNNSLNVWTDPKKIAEIINMKTGTFKDENLETNFLLNHEITFMKRNTIAFLIAYFGSLIFGYFQTYLLISTLLSPLLLYSVFALYFIYKVYPKDPYKEYTIIKYQNWIAFTLMTWFLLFQFGMNQIPSLLDKNYSQSALLNVVFICLISFGSIQMIEIPLKLSGLSIGISFFFYYLAILIFPKNFEFDLAVWRTLGICFLTYMKNLVVSFMSKYREDISKRVVFYLSTVYKVSLKSQKTKTSPKDVSLHSSFLKWKRSLFSFNFYIFTDNEFNKNYDMNQKEMVFDAINSILLIDWAIETLSGSFSAASYDKSSTFFWLFVIKVIFLFVLAVFYNLYYRFYIKTIKSEKEIRAFYYISALLVTLDNAINMVEFLSNANEITPDNRYPFYSRMDSAFITACVNYVGLAMCGLRMPYYLPFTLLAQLLTVIGVFLVSPYLQYPGFKNFLLGNLFNQIMYLIVSLIVARYLMKIWVSYDILQKKQEQFALREANETPLEQKSIQFSEILAPGASPKPLTSKKTSSLS